MEIESSTPLVATAANLFRDIVYKYKDALLAGIICAGWDNVDGGSVYSINLGGSLVKQRVAVSGSGSSYIYGLLDSEYKENMTREQCEAFCVKGKKLFSINSRGRM